MTTFPIPEGKVVDRIELESGEGKATINIIYKEGTPKSPLHLVMIATNEPTTLYYQTNLKRVVEIFEPIAEGNKNIFLPIVLAETGEFVVVPDKEVREIIDRLNNRLDVLRCSLQGKAHNLSTLAAIQGIYDCCGQLEYSITEQGE